MNTIVLDSRDQQGNVWNAKMLQNKQPYYYSICFKNCDINYYYNAIYHS